MPNTRAQRNRSAAGLRNRDITVLGVGETSGVSLQIFISGDPIAQPRPRFAVTQALRTYIYNPAARAKTFFSRKMKQELQETGLASTANPIFTLPGVEVQVQFGLADMSKDLDNMLKFILDVLEDAGVYANDCLVRKIVAEKVQSNTGFTSLSVSYMDLGLFSFGLSLPVPSWSVDSWISVEIAQPSERPKVPLWGLLVKNPTIKL